MRVQETVRFTHHTSLAASQGGLSCRHGGSEVEVSLAAPVLFPTNSVQNSFAGAPQVTPSGATTKVSLLWGTTQPWYCWPVPGRITWTRRPGATA